MQAFAVITKNGFSLELDIIEYDKRAATKHKRDLVNGYGFESSEIIIKQASSESVIYDAMELIGKGQGIKSAFAKAETKAEAEAEAEALAQVDTLTTESAIAYVHSTFAGSFDSVVSADLMQDCGAMVCVVAVQSKGILCRAYVWHDAESGKLYGEL